MGEQHFCLINTYTSYTEPEVLTLWQQGDEKAFDFLYRKYFLTLVNTAIRKVGSPDMAEELVQDVFLSVYLKRDTFLPSSGLAPYLFKSLQNRIFDYYRKKLTEEKYEESLKNEMRIVYDDTHQNLEAKELSERVHQKIRELPESRRKIFMMRQEGISNKEIAQRLNISINTVENQIHKALRFLKSSLGNFLLLFL